MSNWKTAAKAKFQEVKGCIPKEWQLPSGISEKYNETNPINLIEEGTIKSLGILTDKEIEITENFSLNKLLNKIANGELSSFEVATAFCKRSAIATQLTNCCTELMFEDALKRAAYLDEYLKKNGKTLGPLHGLPVSVKDMFDIKGYDSTIGYVSFIGNKKDITDDAAVFKCLIELGAVVHVKTNIPTTLMTADSQNNVFGRTLNPLNLTWTAGGSSGGEGSLIKQRGSLIGVGTDIAGSIRIPSLSNGIYGLKPSFFRFPIQGVTEPSRYNVNCPIKAVAGPLGNSIEDLSFFMDCILNKAPVRKYDDKLLDFPWQTELEPSKTFKIGYVIEDKGSPVYPPLKRIISDAVSKLGSKDNFELIEIKYYPSFLMAQLISFRLFASDPNDTSIPNILKSGEPFIPSLTKPHVEIIPPKGEELFELQSSQQQFRSQWLKAINDLDLDAILVPGSNHTTCPHDEYLSAGYTVMWNLVDFPAVIIPFGLADASVDVNDTEKFPGYDAQKFDKGPGHIQLVARTLNEEKLLKVAEAVDKVLNG